MIFPGAYIDPAGCPHLFPDEVVAFLQKEHPEAGFDFSKGDYDMIVESFAESLRQEGFSDVTITFLKHERESS